MVCVSNVDAVRRGYEAVERGDFSVIEELLADDVRWHGGDPSFLGACTNRGEALDFMRRAKKRGRVGRLVDVIDAGDQVVVVLSPAEGVERANVTTFRDGKVVEMVAHESRESALAAAGLAPG